MRTLTFLPITLLCLIVLSQPAAAQINLSSSPVWQASPGSYPTGLGWADIDGNGFPDIVVSNGLDVSNAPVVAYFNDNGQFSQVPGWTSGYTSANGCLYLGDLDNDGDQDLVAASLGITNLGLPPENHVIFLNNGSFGGFSLQPQWFSPLGNAFSGTGGDVDGDGDLDLVFGQGDWLTGHLQKTKLFTNNLGLFDTVPSWQSDSSYYSDEVVFADVDMDGDLDLALGNERPVGNVAIAIFYNNNGTLETTPSWHTRQVTGGRQMAFGDMDNDGYPELAVASPTQKFYLFDNVNGVLDTVPCWVSTVGNEPSAVAWADVDADGDLDLAAGSWFYQVGIFVNTGGVLADTFAWKKPVGNGTQQIAWADYDEDYLVDSVKTFTGDGNKKLFYLGYQPVHKITAIEVNGSPLPLNQYCYDLTDGWISLATPPSSGEIVTVRFSFSNDLDMALTTWAQVKVYENLNETTGLGDLKENLSGSRLGQNYPNPFSKETTIEFFLWKDSYVTLNIYDLHGQNAFTLAEGKKTAGHYRSVFYAGSLAAGVYTCLLRTDDAVQTRKLILIK
ncbi:MAG: FG-GAP-like repeat-containing protein [Bacteroidetes bacterium]|nr:FG-GAP-like repeat-containing protein [Bacteroidota bacterium]